MKLVHVESLISSGSWAYSVEAQEIRASITNGIEGVTWPPNSDEFSIYSVKHGNGVTPIKDSFIKHLEYCGWLSEQRMALASTLGPGKVDAITRLRDGRFFAVEWETGNISSSHRALNKIALGILDGVLAGGALVLPSRQMYQFLTDRVGNYSEIAPYFPMWKALPIQGVLDVYVVEYDHCSMETLPIPKGTDGRALR